VREDTKKPLLVVVEIRFVIPGQPGYIECKKNNLTKERTMELENYVRISALKEIVGM